MRFGVLFALSLLTGCSTPERHAPRPPEPYVRIANAKSNIVQLQIAARKFLPIASPGPAVWLVGVAHVGESNYFAALQRHLDAQSLVLVEGIRGLPAEVGEGSPDRSALQSSLASSLGLAFQLEAIRYDRPNFRNSDLSVDQLRRLLAEQPGASVSDGAAQSFESLLEMMEGNSVFDPLIRLGLRFMQASPKLRAAGRLALIEMLGAIQGDPSRLGGLPPQMQELFKVIIEARDQKVIADLKARLCQVGPAGSIAVFYGIGHMPDLELRLRRDLSYHPASQLWYTAFSVNLAQAGLSEADCQFIRGLVRLGMGSRQPTR